MTTNHDENDLANLGDSFCNESDIENTTPSLGEGESVNCDKTLVSEDKKEASQLDEASRLAEVSFAYCLLRSLIFGLLICMAILVGIVMFRKPIAEEDGECLWNEQEVSRDETATDGRLVALSIDGLLPKWNAFSGFRVCSPQWIKINMENLP